MIRRANYKDLAGIMRILQSVGTAIKDPVQGFLMNDYTSNLEYHKQKYAEDLSKLRYSYVYLEEGIIKAFLMAYTRSEWLTEVPDWEACTIWAPHFDKARLANYVLINQTAMLPELTGKGLGSLLYSRLFAELVQDGYSHVFAETVIAPYPNFASLSFRVKQKYQFAGLRYEELNGTNYTTLVYYKDIAKYV